MRIRFITFFTLLVLLFSGFSSASTIDNISVDKIEVYVDKSKIPYLGSNGWAIPANTKIIVFKTKNPSYVSWKFVLYGNALDETFSLLLTAKATGKNVSCVWEDRGNYWAECVGLSVE